jgi:hypothetical protein
MSSIFTNCNARLPQIGSLADSNPDIDLSASIAGLKQNIVALLEAKKLSKRKEYD